MKIFEEKSLKHLHPYSTLGYATIFSHPKLFKIYRFQASPINMNLGLKM